MVAAALALTAACGGDDGPPLAQPDDVEPEIVTMSPDGDDDATDAVAPTRPVVTLPESVAVTLTPVLDIAEPVDLVVNPATGSTFVASKNGVVSQVDLDSGTVIAEVLDLGGGLASTSVEQGLLGIEFSPDGDQLYANFTESDGSSIIAAWPVDGDSVDAESGRMLLEVDQPAPNHNGGDLAFGPDGLLYITLGDGGGAGDEFDQGQDPDTLLATVLRIAPDAGEPYGVPDTNRFVDGGGRSEIFLYGVRNAWRIDFDEATGDLWIADVGQDAVEEVNVLWGDGSNAGTNLGWPLVEGSAPFAADGPPAEGYVAPVYEYGSDEGCSVTGGVVYRGSAIPELDGLYLFGDYCTSQIWALAATPDGGALGRVDLGVGVGSGLVGFAAGPDAEVYVLALDGRVLRIDPA